MNEIRLTIRCTKEPNHAKILQFRAGMGLTRIEAEALGDVFCGTSELYIHKPGPGSPIGRCACCGATLEYEIEDRQ